MNNVRIKILRESAKIPTKAYHSAGYDLYPAMSGTIKPGEQIKIPLGFATEFPSGYVAQIDDRSSTGNAGLSHMAGVIDSDYRGEWCIMLRNFADVDFVYSPEKAIAQVLFIQVENPTWSWAEELAPSFRGDKAYGSSDSVMGSPRVLAAVSEELLAQAEDRAMEHFVKKDSGFVNPNIRHIGVGNHLNIKQQEPPDKNAYQPPGQP